MTENKALSAKIGAYLLDNIVMVVFIVFVIFGFAVSEHLTASAFTNDLMARFFRNGVLVLSLIIPVMAGLGLNFGIVVGALAGLLSIIFVRYNYMIFPGIGGLVLCFVLATPLAMLFGYLTGKLYNAVRGQEMVASLVVSFFAEGIYMIIVLFVIGGIIPVRWGHRMINPVAEGARPIGVRHTFEMGLPEGVGGGRGFAAQEPPGMARALNNLWQVEFVYALAAVAVVLFAFILIRRLIMRKNPILLQIETFRAFIIKSILCGVLMIFAIVSSAQIYYWYIEHARQALLTPGIRLDQLEGIPSFVVEISRVDPVPAVIGLIIVAIGLFMVYFTRTKLGQDCRAVGQSQPIANVSGIDIDRTRIIATVISTVLAAWGMIIFVQDMGHVSTYTMHRNIGFFSVAAILVGGATAARASVKNAIIGVVLFHAMFAVSPAVGIFIFDDANAGEYMRTSMVYGVIGVSLGLYVWKNLKAAKEKERLPRDLDKKSPPVRAHVE